MKIQSRVLSVLTLTAVVALSACKIPAATDPATVASYANTITAAQYQ